MARIKGAAVREFLSWYAHHHSFDALRDAVRSLPEPLQVLFDGGDASVGVLASSWYDSAAVGALIDAVFATIPEHERAAAVRCAAEFAVGTSMRGIYRFVIARLSPELYCRNIQRLWGMLHDDGTREIEVIGPGHVRSHLRDWSGHHPLLCLGTVETMRAVFMVMGCREVEARRIACVAAGAPECVSELSWSPRGAVGGS